MINLVNQQNLKMKIPEVKKQSTRDSIWKKKAIETQKSVMTS
jgi:hypothetical protein